MHDLKHRVVARKPSGFEMQRGQFQKQLYRDNDLARCAMRVGLSIATRFNRQIFDHDDVLKSWPSIDWISKDTGMARRNVQRGIRDLQARGHVRILEGGGGRGKPHHYAAVIRHDVRFRVINGDGGKGDKSRTKKGDNPDIRTFDREPLRERF